MSKLTWSRIAAWRVRRHHLDKRLPAGSMLAAASELCGLHAQLLSSAALTVWARVESLERGAIQRALWEDRTLVKTWAMRGTLHLFPADDLPLWHAALSTSRRYRKPGLWRRFGLTLDELDRLTEAVGAALDGCLMTREELAEKVGQMTGSRRFVKKLAFGSWGTILKPAAMTGRLCFAPSAGQRVRFTRPKSWIPELGPQIDTHLATKMVTSRFLATYGPATYDDLARWWGGGGITTARQWIAAMGEEVSPVEMDGVQAWMLASEVRQACEHTPQRSVRLIPAFDQYVVCASRHAEHLLIGAPRSRVYRPQGWISPVLLINGFLQGVWHHEIKGSQIEVVIEPFIKIPSWARRSAEAESERLAAFFGCKLNLAWKNELN
ncbi:MAG TPA: winged helix DNA-binding domain-containing protein [Terriglobales bacterium]